MLTREDMLGLLEEPAAQLQQRGVRGDRALYQLSGFTSLGDALAHVERMYPHRPIPARAQYLLEELFPPA